MFGLTKGTVTKIFRIGSELVGIAGSASAGMEVIDWYKRGALPEDYPEYNRGDQDGTASLLVIRADGTAWKYESTPHPFQLEGEFIAVGCGDESAMVAMAMGASARDAVELVIKFNSACGMGVDWLSLDEDADGVPF